ncbi:MAG: dTDP-4-dehydrorhamnose reductase [Candidatus Helarchaeota archaeon]|nr:dTDP-4-dehydrorhamnose reductase [Candidatus Helarchaeota archaeon]
MRVVVIGANGQLGSDICLILKKKYEVIELIQPDIEITDKNSIEKVLIPYKGDFIINTAAYHDLKKCEEKPELAFAVNATGSRDLARWCLKNNSVLLHVSTDYVFDGKKGSPYTESDLAKPLNTYGISKLAGEHYIEAILNKYIIIRVSGLYGVHPCIGKPGKNFVEMFINLIDNKETQEFGGQEWLTPTSTQNIANQLIPLIESNQYGLFHVTNEGECSWFEFGEEIIRQIGSSTILIRRKEDLKKDPLAIKRPKYSVLENERLKKLGINIMPQWKDALKEYLKLRNNK